MHTAPVNQLHTMKLPVLRVQMEATAKGKLNGLKDIARQYHVHVRVVRS